ncbi:hypothetical protein A3G63_01570 [Candidatus Kaiserbacteria bacterium RIFCSPLOWO2_12_FULL_52_8]|uniref:Uncharacterized protein n=1 Tax=Candidatus Kaiserbacteria bacterium RIFCSPHIGHO2_01_FULL_53_31 TaxID=1798481 RepID=A0A1F6CI35_9BACT|nr:MAG: hypothetical protein A2678_02450 [Candidatus Kaiserbacteria bacterium RIFCSPHIGHO2_01_FULL_53_31]OGG93174.1 MAG: hypothetical protein A3G63_01570 [Candidatus Kaiserbacteria bacterium RIFCSPLOWO2_12_FULL_52_8]
MIGQISRNVFFLCLYPCAILVLFFIWNSGPPSPLWFQSAASLFVIGLTAFLTWFVTFAYKTFRKDIVVV